MQVDAEDNSLLLNLSYRKPTVQAAASADNRFTGQVLVCKYSQKA